MKATPQHTPPIVFLDGWPNTQNDPQPLTEAEAFALMFEGRSFSTQTQAEFFAVWSLQAMHKTAAADWFGVRAGDIALADDFAKAFLKFRNDRTAPIGALDCAAVCGLAGFFAAIPAANYPQGLRPTVEDVAALCFNFARRAFGAGRNLKPTNEQGGVHE